MPNEPWQERARILNTPSQWRDDEDILDAFDRAEARESLTDEPVTPIAAALTVQEPRKKWVNPYVALLDEITRTQSYVILLEVQVTDLDSQGGAHHAGRRGTNLLQRFDRERDRLITACKTAISLGIAERQVRLAERQGELLSRAAISAVDRTPNLSPDQRRHLLTNLAQELRALEPSPT